MRRPCPNTSGPRDPMFWGNALLLAIETTMIAMLVSGYFYLRGKLDPWRRRPYPAARDGAGENLLFLALLFRGPVERKLMVDLDVNGFYWYFVVGGWAVTFAVVYLEFWLRG
jgi:hypothetical protein